MGKNGFRGYCLTGILLLIQGCSGGGGDSQPAGATTVTIQGSVGDGPIVDATIVVSDRDGNEIARGQSDSSANYSIDVPNDTALYPLTLRASGGQDIVTNAAPDFELVSAVTQTNNGTANLNPFSTLMVETTASMPGGLSQANLDSARSVVYEQLGFGIDDEVVSDPIQTPVSQDNVASLIKSSEAAGELVRRVRDSLVATGSDRDGDAVVAALAADLTDGVLDGDGAAGSDPRLAATAHIVGGQVLLETMTNSLTVNGVDAMSAMDAAIQTSLPDAPAGTSTADVPVTAQAIAQAKLSVEAAQSIAPSATLDALSTALDSVTPGVSPAIAAQTLPSNPSGAMDSAANMVPLASDEDIESINDTARTDNEVTPNRPPNISGVPSAVVDEGANYSFEPSASDPDGDTLIFLIENQPDWATFSNSTGTLSGTPRANDIGTYPGITISVSDGLMSVALPTFDITVNALDEANSAPTISGTPQTSVQVGGNYLFEPTAADADGDNLTFSVTNRPAWASFDAATGALSGTPGDNDVGTANGIVIRVSDGSASAALNQFSITVTGNPAPPTMVSAVRNGDVYELAWSAPSATPDGGYDVFVDNVDTGATYRTTNLQQTIPGLDTTVEHCFAVESRYPSVNEFHLSNELCVDGTPDPVNQPPVISGTPAATVSEGQTYSFTPAASDPDGDSLSFSVVNQPAWASFNANNGNLSGTPGSSDVGSYTGIVIRVSDGTETTALPSFDVTVNPNAPANNPPVIGGSPGTQIDEGATYSFQPTASDPDDDPLSFSITNRPSWASFNAASGALTGTPGSNDVGTYSNIVIRVTDGTATVALPAFTIQVNGVEPPNTAPTIGGTPATSVTEGQAYSFTPTAADVDGDTLTFSVANRPSWASFNSNTGQLSGTPSSGDTGTYSGIVISVSDGTETVSLPAFAITVNQAATGSVTLSWTAPTLNTDGSPLADLSAYRLYYGTSSGSYPNQIDINNPGLTTYVVDNLTVGSTYYFVITAIDSANVESSFSNEAAKTVP